MSKIGELGVILNGASIPGCVGKYPAFGGNGHISFVNSKNYDGETIVIGRVGANCGSVHYVEGDCWVTDNALAMKVSDMYDSKYVYYLLKLLDLNKYHIGSSQPLITQGIINQLEFDYEKDKTKQSKISYVLSIIDKKIENNNKISAELESLAKTIYDYWFLQFEFPNEEGKPYKSSGGKMVYNEELKREIPEGWEVKHYSDLAETKTGKEDANFATVDGKYAYFTCGSDILRCDDYKFDGKALLVAGNGDFNVKYYDGKFNAYQRTYVLMPDEEYIGILYQQITRKISQFRKGSNGSIVKFITKGDIDNIELLIPQNKELLKPFDLYLEAIEHNNKQNQQLASLRDWLLPMLMNGQVTFNKD